ncbi:hypothetical protein DMH03_18770 [Amycolatopsis sp. WAC 01376]|nr:hypothetical protein DMH03_18770 [Amycolatopsis sp. WAC 01376]
MPITVVETAEQQEVFMFSCGGDCVDFGALDDQKSTQSCVIGPVTRDASVGDFCWLGIVVP